MEFFKFPLPALTDLQISISATSGDPDLFISLGGFYPQCTPSASGFSIYCQNWTWSSTSYVTDQVIISQDYPCDAVMPGTHVSGDCQPRDFHAGEVHIGVYGYSDSKFHVMVTPRGQHIQLLPGEEDDILCHCDEGVIHVVDISLFPFSRSSTAGLHCTWVSLRCAHR